MSGQSTLFKNFCMAEFEDCFTDKSLLESELNGPILPAFLQEEASEMPEEPVNLSQTSGSDRKESIVKEEIQLNPKAESFIPSSLNNRAVSEVKDCWKCSDCQNINYPYRTRCYLCQQPRYSKDRSQGSSRYRRKYLFSKLLREHKLDWPCYNCGNINFSFRNECNKCGRGVNAPFIASVCPLLQEIIKSDRNLLLQLFSESELRSLNWVE